MGDHRVLLKIEMHAHGRDYSTEMSINWTEDAEGVDPRVKDWLRESYEDSLAAYDDQVFAAEQRELEHREREELARLRAKYG